MKTFAEFTKFKERVEAAYKSLESHRDARLRLIRQFVGNAYGPEAADGSPETLINMVELQVNSLLQNLISGSPRVMVSTDKFQLKTSAKYFQMALNHVAAKIDLRTALVGFVTESLFSMGMMKIGVTSEHDDGASGFLHDPFLPFADPVYFDDLVYDTKVPFWEQVSFVGNHYRMDKEDIEADERNDPTAVKEIGESATRWDLNAGERAEDLAWGDREGGFGSGGDERKQVDLWDLWVPRKQQIITYAETGGERPLRTQDWDGPENGPYSRPLCYNPVLNNVQPVPPVSTVSPMSDLLNHLWNKIGEQASRQKTIGFYHPSNIKDAQRVQHASDGELVASNNPANVSQMRFGGAEQTTMAAAALVNEKASYVGGNINSYAGLSSDANTLGQQELMSNSANGRIRSMQQHILIAVRDIFRDIGWHIWNDPLVDLTLTGEIRGTDVEFETRWPRQEDEFGNEHDLREGQYNDLNFEIDPFSMKDQTPEGKLALLRNVVQTEVIPLIGALQQAGKTFDIGGYFRLVGEFADMPELAELIQDAAMPAEEQGPPPSFEKPGKPANTTRTYERVRGKGPSSGGLDRAMAMAGGGGGSDQGSGVQR